jgi:outer membrane lipoprotein carrier protein LolA
VTSAGRLAFTLFLLLVTGVRANSFPGPSLLPGQSLHGRFVQERHLSGLNAPLTTEGDFLLVPGKGLIWRSAKPFEAATIITPAGIRQIVNGTEVQSLSAARLPFLTRFYDMVGGALLGDWSALAKDFSIGKTGNAAAWRIALTPSRADDPVAGQLRSIVVTGGRLADLIEIHRANGDWERIQFLDLSSSTQALSNADAALLEGRGP